jgi:hypothetical protein
VIATTLQRLLDDPAERRRLGDIGRTRIGGPGAIDQIIAAILDCGVKGTTGDGNRNYISAGVP